MFLQQQNHTSRAIRSKRSRSSTNAARTSKAMPHPGTPPPLLLVTGRIGLVVGLVVGFVLGVEFWFVAGFVFEAGVEFIFVLTVTFSLGDVWFVLEGVGWFGELVEFVFRVTFVSAAGDWMVWFVTGLLVVALVFCVMLFSPEVTLGETVTVELLPLKEELLTVVWLLSAVVALEGPDTGAVVPLVTLGLDVKLVLG